MLDVVRIDQHEPVRQAVRGEGVEIGEPRNGTDEIALAVDHHERAPVVYRPDQIVVVEELHELRLTMPRAAHDVGVLEPGRERNCEW